jgi:hypothetical protein
MNPTVDLRRLEQLHAVRCQPSELKKRVADALSTG